MKKWEVWLADVSFEDIDGSKKRPVLIVDNQVFFVHCLKMTSQAPRAGEYVLTYWQHAGLKKPTVVRVGKLLALTSVNFIHRIGILHPADILGVQAALRLYRSRS